MLYNKYHKPRSLEHICYLTISSGQESACNLAGSSAQGLTRLQDIVWAVFSFRFLAETISWGV